MDIEKVLNILKKYKVNIYYDIYMLPTYALYVSIQKRYRVKVYLQEDEWILLKDWLGEDHSEDLKNGK